MDCRGRRGRRGRCHSHSRAHSCHSFIPPLQNHRAGKGWIFSDILDFVVLSCLIGVIYMMLDYQCVTCSAKCDLHNITSNLNEISHHLAILKDNYKELESNISKFSRDLPKIEGQVKLLENLARSMDCGNFGCEPKSPKCLPRCVDANPNHCGAGGDIPAKPQHRYGEHTKKNLTKQTFNQFPRSPKVKQVYSNSNIIPIL